MMAPASRADAMTRRVSIACPALYENPCMHATAGDPGVPRGQAIRAGQLRPGFLASLFNFHVIASMLTSNSRASSAGARWRRRYGGGVRRGSGGPMHSSPPPG